MVFLTLQNDSVTQRSKLLGSYGAIQVFLGFFRLQDFWINKFSYKQLTYKLTFSYKQTNQLLKIPQLVFAF